MKHLQAKLLEWYHLNKRDLPWRNTKNPYYVWLSEIILQQTRVAQGLPYFEKFISTYPTVNHLANATEDDVLKLWQGLGYYSRARNLHATAKHIAYHCDGIFPTTYKELLTLKGVGDYTASAISSFCYQEPKAVLDGNVFRFLSRFFGVSTAINTPKGKKEFGQLSQKILNLKDPASHNQAIMEFGANQCKPKNPNCGICIFNDKCIALQQQKINELPVKEKRVKIKKRYFNYIVPIIEEQYTLLQKRTQNGIWKNLYEFPLIESAHSINYDEIINLIKKEKHFTSIIIDSLSVFNEQPIIHKLSHQHINATFWILKTSSIPQNTIDIQHIQKYAVPTLLANFINRFPILNSKKHLKQHL